MTKPNNIKYCTWQRIGDPWPDNKHNYWLTGCGATDHGKLARGLCPHCANPVAGKTLEMPNGDQS